MTGKETEDLVGQWILVGGKVVADEVEQKIEDLIRNRLALVSTSEDGWKSVFVDKSTGERWELTFPNSSWHGGGPRRLRRLGPP